MGQTRDRDNSEVNDKPIPRPDRAGPANDNEFRVTSQQDGRIVTNPAEYDVDDYPVLKNSRCF